jgi:hypothetical protein
MEPIQDRMLLLKARNFDTIPFIPIRELEELLTETVIRDVIYKCGIDAPKREETIQIVVSGAKKIFATLILLHKEHLVRKFIEQDQFQIEKLDAKLPLSDVWLRELLGQATGSLFWEKQWMFVAPFFRYDLSHRILEDATILPFINKTFIGEGGFGAVFKVELHPQHQGVKEFEDDAQVRVVTLSANSH